MKRNLKLKWVVPVAALILTVSIGSAAFAASGASSTDTTAAATVTAGASASTGSAPDSATQGSTSSSSGATNPWGKQRSDETLLTGDALAKVTAIATEKAGAGATIVRVETDSDATQTGHGPYEAHVVTAGGTAETIYVDANFNYVSTETMQAGSHQGRPNDNDADDASSTGGSTSTPAGSASTTVQ